MKKDRKPRLNRDGLPVDKNAWVEEDWASLHRHIEAAKQEIRERHENDDDTRGRGESVPNKQ